MGESFWENPVLDFISQLLFKYKRHTIDRSSFKTLNLAPAWFDTLDHLSYNLMTPIQQEALPLLLEGRDLIGHADTGTGKTAAFGLALLTRITPANQIPGGIVLCPTRELAEQVAAEIRRLARALPNTTVVTLYGGRPVRQDRIALENGVDVVVGTPGRVLAHLQRGRLDLSEVEMVVIDEADRMLDMGFIDDVTEIVGYTPEACQTVMMSATMSADVRHVTDELLRDPVLVSVVEQGNSPEIEQSLWDASSIGRLETLKRLLGTRDPDAAIVFCNERITCDEITEELDRVGHSVRAMHGGMEQRERDDVLTLFSNGSLRVLVATNVAARGIDISSLDAVINYELPHDPKSYVHRIGRTGRAGEKGVALTIIDGESHRDLERYDELATAKRNEASRLERPHAPRPAKMLTLTIRGGRKDKLRPGDIVGALTGDCGLPSGVIGDITIKERIAFVAIERDHAQDAYYGISRGKIKGKTFGVFYLR